MDRGSKDAIAVPDTSKDVNEVSPESDFRDRMLVFLKPIRFNDVSFSIADKSSTPV